MDNLVKRKKGNNMSTYFNDAETAYYNQPIETPAEDLTEHIDIMDSSFYIIVERLQRKGYNKEELEKLMERFDSLYNDLYKIVGVQ